MKSRDGRVICEKCEGEFVAYDRIAAIYKTDGIFTAGSIGIPMVDVKQTVDYAHLECLESPATESKTDDIKEWLVKSDQASQQEIYRFLHDALGRRL